MNPSPQGFKDFQVFFKYESMGPNDHGGGANFVTRGMVGSICIGDIGDITTWHPI